MQLDLFIKALKKQRKLMIIVALFIGLFGIGMVFIPANTSKDWAIKLGIVAFFQLVAILMLWVAKDPPERHPFIRALNERIEDIVWVYVQHNRQNGAHVAYIMVLCFKDGKSVQAPFPKELEEEAKLTVLTLVGPDVVFGFSEDLLKVYKQDPASFGK